MPTTVGSGVGQVVLFCLSLVENCIHCLALDKVIHYRRMCVMLHSCMVLHLVSIALGRAVLQACNYFQTKNVPCSVSVGEHGCAICPLILPTVGGCMQCPAIFCFVALKRSVFCTFPLAHTGLGCIFTAACVAYIVAAVVLR